MTPILLITFNRPETTKQVFARIKKVKPCKLFIFSDGPREDVEGDTELIMECRDMFQADNIDWDCDLTYIYNASNMGCGRGIVYAISKVFESVDRLIILEDDIIPALSFFDFCETMLERYASETRVMHIAGTRWNEEFNTGSGDHFFSTIGHIWGWATWKRAWQKFDHKASALPEFKQKNTLYKLYNSKKIMRYWHKLFEEVYGIRHTGIWDYAWQFMLFSESGLAVVPTVNLTSNIGVEGVHSDGRITEHHFRTLSKWKQEQSYEEVQHVEILPNLNFDKYHIKMRFLKKPPLHIRALNRFKKLGKL